MYEFSGGFDPFHSLGYQLPLSCWSVSSWEDCLNCSSRVVPPGLPIPLQLLSRIQISLPGFLCCSPLSFSWSMPGARFTAFRLPGWESLYQATPPIFFLWAICSYIPGSKHSSAIFHWIHILKLNLANGFRAFFQGPNIPCYKINIY